MRFFALWAATAFMAGTSALYAAESQPDPRTFPALAPFVQKNANMTWLGAWGGLNGWFIVEDTNVIVTYTTPDGQGLVSGILTGADGTNITSQQIDNLKKNGFDLERVLGNAMVQSANQKPATAPQTVATAPAKDTRPAGEQLYDRLQSATWFEEGNPAAAPTMYMIADPTCPYCKQLHEKLTVTGLASNKMRLRVIPVGVLSDRAGTLALDVMTTTKPSDAWAALAKGQKIDSMPKDPAVDESAMSEKLYQNALIMSAWKMKHVPFIAYRDTKGKVKVLEGMPNDMFAMLADMGVTP